MSELMKSEAVRRFAIFVKNRSTTTPLVCHYTGKISFRTSTAAEKYIQANQQEGRVGSGMLSAYQCDKCVHFHTTSSPPNVKPAPDDINARKSLRESVRPLSEHMYRQDISNAAIERETQKFIELDRWVRTAERSGFARPVDEERVTMRQTFARYTQSANEVVAHCARRIVDELVPLALDEESWTWALAARSSLMEEFDKATGEGDAGGIPLAMERYTTILDSHISSQGLDRKEVYLSEFVLMSDATEDWVEFSVFEDETARMMDALLDMESSVL